MKINLKEIKCFSEAFKRKNMHNKNKSKKNYGEDKSKQNSRIIKKGVKIMAIMIYKNEFLTNLGSKSRIF